MPRGLRAQVRPDGQRLLSYVHPAVIAGSKLRSYLHRLVVCWALGRAARAANAHSRHPTTRTHSKLVVWSGVVDRLLKLGRRAAVTKNRPGRGKNGRAG